MRKPRLVVCMGVSGCGKSTLGAGLAARLACPFVDADDFHSAAAKRKMASGDPLSDADRAPWMQRITEHLMALAASGEACVMAHSALRRTHREQLRHCGYDTRFLHLTVPPSVLHERLAQRQNHFVSDNLLQSQLDTLQAPDNEPDVSILSAQLSIGGVLAAAERALELSGEVSCA
ncbi:MAG: gluconokinase, GntK/IdnK-type [Pseudomonadota bacterium]